MRTTIRLDDSLLREAKARAARAGRSLNDFIADAVRLALSETTLVQDTKTWLEEEGVSIHALAFLSS